MRRLDRLDRTQRWFVVAACAGFIVAFIVTVVRFPTEDRIERAFMRKLFQAESAQSLEANHMTADEGVELQLRDNGGSFEKWVNTWEANQRERVEFWKGELSKYPNLGDEQRYLTDAEISLATWHNRLSRLHDEVADINHARIKFLVIVFGMCWSLPLAAAYAFIRGARWAAAGAPQPSGAVPPREAEAAPSAPNISQPSKPGLTLSGGALKLATAVVVVAVLLWAVFGAVANSEHGQILDWYFMELGYFFAGYVISFALAWYVLKNWWDTTNARLAIAFVTGWAALPAVSILLRRHPETLGPMMLVLQAAWAVLALWLFSVGKPMLPTPTVGAETAADPQRND